MTPRTLTYIVASLTALVGAVAADWGPGQRLPDTVNSPYIDWGVCATADGNAIYFSSNRENPRRWEEDIYYSRRVGTSWTPAVKITGPVNTADLEGAPCLTWDDRFMYFTRGVPGTPTGDIWVSPWTGAGWGTPWKIPGQVNTSEHWENNPAISATGETLFFTSSDRPGNLGTINIWYSVWTGSEWGTPRFINGINTTYSEYDPAPTYDGRYLYFGSFRPPSAMKLYRAENLGGGEWGNVEMLNPNVNVPGFVYTDPFVTKDGRYLFYARAPLNDNYDIYVSEWSEPAVAPTSLGKVKALFR